MATRNTIDPPPAIPSRPARLMRRAEVLNRTSITGISGLYAMIAAGEFPKPVKLSPTGRSVAWIECEVDAYIESRIAARNAK